jgi:hypothetical protein
MHGRETLPVPVLSKSIQEACQKESVEAWRAPDGVPPGALNFNISQSVSRVLDGAQKVFTRVTAIPLGRRSPDASSNLPGRPDPDRIPKLTLARKLAPSLFGLAPGGVCRAAGVAPSAVRSYRTVSPLPRPNATRRGGLFSVALSLDSHPPDVIRHRLSAEPGLSSPATFRFSPERPSDRLTG